jgi:branched-chain amino acid transport system ATP-binding protein
MTVPPILELRAVSAGYAGYRTLFGVTMSVPDGAIVALLGAGKSTLARVATGLVPASEGQVLVAGRDATAMAAHRIARLGVAHVPEGRGVFGELDVEENLVLSLRRRVGRRAMEVALEQGYDTFPVLAARRRQRAATLSGGEQRMLSLAGVLAAGTRLVIADELSLGLAPAVVDTVYAGLRAIHQRGTAVVVVEQQIDRALAIAEHAVVLVRGRVSWQGPPSQARAEMERLFTAGYAPPG